MKLRIAVPAAVMLAVAAAHGQAPQQSAVPPSGVAREPIAPTEVLPDGRVTFRLEGPTLGGAELLLANQDPGRVPMTKGADGVWTTTVGPLAPEIYNYSFLVGGGRVDEGAFDVPGQPPRLFELLPVPHGTVTGHHYVSATQNRARELNVYLPPQYHTEPNRRFPVLYLFAGMSEDDWTQGNRANFLFDNLIAQGRAVPTIIVMPNNTVGPKPVPALENARIMGQEITTEIIPMIDRTYRTRPDRLHRAIAGLSFGGGTAFMVGMRNLDRFAYVAEFGSGVFGGGERTAYAPGYADFDPDTITPGLYGKLTAPATRPKLFFMSVGTGDSRAASQKAAYDLFVRNGYTPVWRTYPGGHEAKVFRNSLADLAPLLFR